MKNLILPFFFLLFHIVSFSQTKNSKALVLDFNLLDLPEQVNAANINGNFISGFEKPSMNQSLTMTTNFYSSIHFGVNQSFRLKKSRFLDKLLKTGINTGIDYLMSTVPFGNAWLHEEYHRAIMTKHLINSRNEVYRFNLFAPTISVNNVKDEDLENLADNFKGDFRRLQSAGGEAQIHQVQKMQTNNFFYNQDLANTGSYWLSTIGNIAYIYTCINKEIDHDIYLAKLEEGTNISKRDFTGLDYIAWADAVVNPEKDYNERGVHPSGIGIDRALYVGSLSTEAFNYLELQSKLHWINIVSPAMFLIDRIKLKSTENGNHYGNFAFRHTLTPFGYDVSLDLFYQAPKYNFAFTIHNYNSKSISSIGLETKLVDFEVLKNYLSISPRLMIWMQPEDASYYAEKYKVGSLASFSTRYENLPVIKPYITLEAKSNGFVMGNAYLGSNFGFRAGLQFDIAAKMYNDSFFLNFKK